MTDTIQNPTYDEMGHIVRNDRSGNFGDMSYEYGRVHGWLTRIKGFNSPTGRVFDQKLYREKEGDYPRWNGSVSAMEWQYGSQNKRRND